MTLSRTKSRHQQQPPKMYNKETRGGGRGHTFYLTLTCVLILIALLLWEWSCFQMELVKYSKLVKLGKDRSIVLFFNHQLLLIFLQFIGSINSLFQSCGAATQRMSQQRNILCMCKIDVFVSKITNALTFSGYRVVQHGGDLSGFHSLLTMLPDMNQGTFFTCNTEKNTNERMIISMFLQDILLEGESWLDVETACDWLSINITLPVENLQAEKMKGIWVVFGMACHYTLAVGCALSP